jgi:predicted transcriptional regulator
MNVGNEGGALQGRNYSAGSPTVSRLGEREHEVLETLWVHGDATVQQVADRLTAPLAYTTVMTILDRLFKKRLVLREKQQRAFVYSAAVTASTLELGRTKDLVRQFFAGSVASQDVLLSCFVDAVRNYDAGLLANLEEKIRSAKEQALRSATAKEDR